MSAYMNEVALATFSSFDTEKHPSKKLQPERFYHGVVLGLLVELRGNFGTNRRNAVRYEAVGTWSETRENSTLWFCGYDSGRRSKL